MKSTASTCLLVAMAGVLALPSAQCADAPGPNIEIVVASKLNTPKEHNTRCANVLSADAAACFRGRNVARPGPGVCVAECAVEP